MANKKYRNRDMKLKVSPNLVALAAFGLATLIEEDGFSLEEHEIAIGLNMAEVMKAYVEGKTIQSRPIDGDDEEFYDDYAPQFDWVKEAYRVRPQT